MDEKLLILLAVLLGLLLISAIICLIYVLTSPHGLVKHRRQGVSFSDGANIADGRIEQNTSGLKGLGNEKDTVVVSANLRIKNNAYIVRLFGRNSKREFVIPINQYAVLGRCHESNDDNFYAVTGSPYVSRHHCIISVINERLYINDYNSFNHTYVNDTLVTNNTPLNNNDVLTIGGAESFDVRISCDNTQQNIILSGNIHRKVR